MNKNLLYHYRSADAFIGMINGGKTVSSKSNSEEIEKSLLFWASSIYTMNDPSEMLYGYDIIKRMIERADEKKILTTYYNQIVITDFTEEQKKTFFLEHFFNAEKTPYAISFSRSIDIESEKDNDEELFMWTMYGDAGKGIRLGFDLNTKATKVIGKKVENSTYLVCYDDDMFEKHYYPLLLQGIKDSYNDLYTIKDEEDIIWEKVSIIASLYTLYCSLIKNPKYKNENEWRIITLSDKVSLDEVKIRTRGALIIPYIEMLIPIRYLKEIVIGPCCDYDLQKRNIEIALKSYGIDINTIRIEKSKIPYRNL